MNKIKNQIPIVALCGFLGSGKTTLLRRWCRNSDLKQAAMIIHDLSDFGLDAELLSEEDKTPAKGELLARVAALHGSHAREHLEDSMIQILQQISDLKPSPPMVLCESTGAARPWPLIQALSRHKSFFIRHFIVTVDALNLHRDFANGKFLTTEQTEGSDPALKHAASILTEQLMFANIIILTKIDTVPKQVVDLQVKNLQLMHPQAAIGLSAQAGLQLEQLTTTPAPKFSTLKKRAEKLELIGQDSTSKDIEALVFQDPKPFHPERLHRACTEHLSTGLYRTKGFLWLASRPSDVLLWQQSASQITLELTGSWRAEMLHNSDGQLMPEEIEHLKEQLMSKHPVYGDRHNELTLIGIRSECERFYKALNEALCTEKEVLAWQNGISFKDPWPQSIKHFS